MFFPVAGLPVTVGTAFVRTGVRAMATERRAHWPGSFSRYLGLLVQDPAGRVRQTYSECVGAQYQLNCGPEVDDCAEQPNSGA